MWQDGQNNNSGERVLKTGMEGRAGESVHINGNLLMFDAVFFPLAKAERKLSGLARDSFVEGSTICCICCTSGFVERIRYLLPSGVELNLG